LDRFAVAAAGWTRLAPDVPPPHHPAEFEALWRAVAKHVSPTSLLEIGSRHGYSLWMLAHTLPPGGLAVSVDLPGGPWGAPDSRPVLEHTAAALRAEGYRVEVVFGDSRDAGTVAAAWRLLPETGSDLCFIDGGHDRAVVASDWRNYGQWSRFVAFHDIAVGHDNAGAPLGVRDVWRRLKVEDAFTWHTEFVRPGGPGAALARVRRAPPG
jgi:Methyltransferase domain